MLDLWPGPTEAASRWAVVVGVDAYQDTEIRPLDGAVADAEGIANALRRYAQFPPEQVRLLTSTTRDKPTRQQILDTFAELKVRVRPEDLLLFFFAGHGVEIEGRRFLLTYEASYASVGSLESTAFPASQLMQKLQSIPARNRLVMVDACRSDPINPSRPQLNAATAALEMEFTLQRLDEEGVKANFLSSKRGQSAYEWLEQKRGFFSYFIEKGLSGDAAVRGRVTVTSLAGYLNEFVPREVNAQRGEEQTPFMDIQGGELVLVDDLGAAPVRPAARTVYGVVKDSSGSPIPRAPVRLAWDSGASRALAGGAARETRATSNDKGFFKADVPREAVVTITAGGIHGYGVAAATSSARDEGKEINLFLTSPAENEAQGLARVAYQSFIVGDWDGAERAGRNAIQKDARNLLAGAVLANCFAFHGVNDRDPARLADGRKWAEWVLTEASGTARTLPLALARNALGLSSYGTGDKAGAAREFRTATELDSRLAIVDSNLGQVYLEWGQYADAERAFRSAIRTEPRNAVPYNGLAQVLIRLGRPQEGVDAALDAISRYHVPDTYLGKYYRTLAAALQNAGEKSAAREASARAASLGAGSSY